jgi:F-type H+-transporting ATPase subunit a
MSLSNPLEQFSIKKIFPMEVFGIDISFTNASLAMIMTVFAISFFMWLTISNKQLIPSKIQVFMEFLYEMILKMVKDYVGNHGQKYFPFIFTIFLFLLFGNIFGLLPYGYTFTSQIIVNFTLAGTIFLIIIFVGIFNQGFKFLRIFFPEGVPLYVAPLLIPVELISFLFKPITLSIRLFANMVAGHVMLKIFATFGVMLLGTIFIPISMASFIINVALNAFEVFVACIQAYIFTTLTCIYLHDALESH